MPNITRVSQLAFWSIIVAIGVMAIKFAAWWLSGSVALYSDALESIVNVIAALIAWFAIRISHKPPDQNHPFGHHKAEYFSAVIEGVLIIVAALLIFREAYSALTTDYNLEAPVQGMIVNAIAAAINGFWAWLLISTGKREKSPALSADGRHIMADVVTSMGVLIGLMIALATGLIIIDAIAAILVGINVLWEGWKVVSSSVTGLMDTAPGTKQSKLIKDTILSNAKGAIEVHDIKVRIAGPVSFIEFHLVVDGSMSVDASHEICDRIETALTATIKGAETTIHVEPGQKKKASGFGVG